MDKKYAYICNSGIEELPIDCMVKTPFVVYFESRKHAEDFEYAVNKVMSCNIESVNEWDACCMLIHIGKAEGIIGWENK